MPIDVARVVGASLAPTSFSWKPKDVILYALGVGVGIDQPATDPRVLRYTYEKDLAVLPTWGVVPSFPCLAGTFSTPGFEINPAMILHGEQKLEILCAAIPTAAATTTTATIRDVWDKGKGAVVVVESTTRTDAGEDLFRNEFSIFIRGEGGFGGAGGPAAPNDAPDREPDLSVETPTLEHQAILYRLSGDANPLHVDPELAAMVGFERPILHGLCTFGNVGRAVLRACCDDDPTRLAAISVRFAAPVMPGETIVTDIWKATDSDLHVRARVKERGLDVVKNARVTLR